MAGGDQLFEDIQDLAGRVLDGRYELERFIDRGGYGAVYKGIDKRLSQPVAIKVGLSSREFMKEARLAAEVKHSNIVQVTDCGSDKGLAYLVMEYLHGEDLDKVFKRQGRRLTPEQLLKLVTEVGDALAYAHSCKLIHRDLKPQNIILREYISRTGTTTGSDRFVLLDFGIASKTDSEGTQRNRTQDGAGTVEYMAPELLGTDPKATEQSDIYAFGVILYQMMTGRVPFPQSDTSQMALAQCFIAISNAPPPRFRDADPSREYPPAIEELVMQCLEKDPARRPQTMAEVRKRYLDVFRSSFDTSLELDVIPFGDVMPEDPCELVGRIIDGRYLLESFIDRGGFGSVFKATDRNIDRTVAIKIGLSSREFKREAINLAKLKHSHIVQVTHHGSDRGLAFLVMEYLHGQNLESLFKSQGDKLSSVQLRKFVDEIGDALEYAHDEQVIHRDLKPKNIILCDEVSKSGATRKTKFVLLDFGIAAKMDAVGTLKGETKDGFGTPEYMAPELLGPTPNSTVQSDIYAFGVVLYQLMTGSAPFPMRDGSHVARTNCIMAILNADPPRFSEIAPNRIYPNGMETLVRECLEKDPGRRPQSMADVRRRFLAIHDAKSKPADSTTRSRRDPGQTIGPDDLTNLGLDEVEPERNEVHPIAARRSRVWGLFPYALVAFVFALWAWSNFSTNKATILLTDSEGKTIEDGSELVLIAGEKAQLTFAIDGLPKDAVVEFEDLAERDFLTIDADNGLSRATRRVVTISALDLNSETTRPIPIVLRGTYIRQKTPFERKFNLTIRKPRPWLPESLTQVGFREAEDSWLCNVNVDHKPCAAILSRTVDGKDVRFRLVPGKKFSEGSVDTFYVMEELVSNRLFRSFAKEKQGFERITRSSQERGWESEALAERPVTNVCALEAQDFAIWLTGDSQCDSQYGSLPSSAEWEVAAGYWDFQKKATPPFESFSMDIPETKVRATIASRPRNGEIREPGGRTLANRSPYGCIYDSFRVRLHPNDDADKEVVVYPVEFTRTFSERGQGDLRKFCRTGLLPADNSEQKIKIATRGAAFAYQPLEISWINQSDELKTVGDFESESADMPLTPDKKGSACSPVIGFRVVILPIRTNSD